MLRKPRCSLVLAQAEARRLHLPEGLVCAHAVPGSLGPLRAAVGSDEGKLLRGERPVGAAARQHELPFLVTQQLAFEP